MNFDESLKKSAASRRNFWSKVGKPHSDVITPAISPDLTGGAPWPTARHAFQPVDVEGHTLIASDGLSDPFDLSDPSNNGSPPDVNGFQLEFFIEAPELKFPDSLASLGSTWAFNALYEMCEFSANGGGQERQVLEQTQYLSIELSGRGLPETCLTPQGRAGFIIGIPSPKISAEVKLPLSSCKLIALTYITPKELQYALDNEKGREEIAARLAKSGTHHLSVVGRKDVV